MNKPTVEEYHNECDLCLLQQYSALSDIVNDIIFEFYAPREILTGAKVLEYHGRYKRWFTNLPEELQILADTTPHVLMLQ